MGVRPTSISELLKEKKTRTSYTAADRPQDPENSSVPQLNYSIGLSDGRQQLIELLMCVSEGRVAVPYQLEPLTLDQCENMVFPSLFVYAHCALLSLDPALTKP